MLCVMLWRTGKDRKERDTDMESELLGDKKSPLQVIYELCVCCPNILLSVLPMFQEVLEVTLLTLCPITF
jgi:hypothetical protein